MNDSFYKSFEDTHRGSRESIAKRLEVYLPFILPFKSIEEVPLCLDLGCGRGEWLELVTSHGFKAKGIDMDANMLSECQKRSLDVLCADAIAALDDVKDASVSILSAFHLIEHIPFEQLTKLVQSSMRVLKEGGLLILETPNPENIIVSTVDFYIDPTHSKPLPPMLLEFLVQLCGFSKQKTLRLHGSNALLNDSNQISLMDVLGGVSPNYAIVAQKHASEDVLELCNEPFTKEYGTTLTRLALRYDEKYAAKFHEQDRQLSNILARIHHLEITLDAIFKSKSWRYTAWLRKLSSLLKS
ncbi:Methyltransferase type 11 [Sulfuricurvum kujiense DSM 16994]|uniref:Methyltransferase type 11 n=1 Tax=Sulfuricurvum kujiense (strain ATCC BAA-921 / DSM 16994 / JCM 11577 / YK-1) TaxID=709032 RepID=E4U376_SULKY|nr:class I SAM-dependent methyltransferase [Sulfuricurvum kujiense]ADR34773.1 Methyltransferase type 11 [Sulfuricurvum kujiense DSM 16994]